MRNVLGLLTIGALMGAIIGAAAIREDQLPEGASVREARLAAKKLAEEP